MNGKHFYQQATGEKKPRRWRSHDVFGRPSGCSDIQLSGLLRETPVLEVDTTNPIATQAKKDMDAYLVAQAEQVDDPWLLLLETAYKGQITKTKSYLGFVVAQYIDGDDKDPERTQCVDEYMTDALEKFSRLEAKRANNSAAFPKTMSDRPPARPHARTTSRKK
jgi:hypothetical protein